MREVAALRPQRHTPAAASGEGRASGFFRPGVRAQPALGTHCSEASLLHPDPQERPCLQGCQRVGRVCIVLWIFVFFFFFFKPLGRFYGQTGKGSNQQSEPSTVPGMSHSVNSPGGTPRDSIVMSIVWENQPL